MLFIDISWYLLVIYGLVMYGRVVYGRVISTFGRGRPRGPGSAAPPRPPGGGGPGARAGRPRGPGRAAPGPGGRNYLEL